LGRLLSDFDKEIPHLFSDDILKVIDRYSVADPIRAPMLSTGPRIRSMFTGKTN
jgi:hypothetical protein